MTGIDRGDRRALSNAVIGRIFNEYRGFRLGLEHLSRKNITIVRTTGELSNQRSIDTARVESDFNACVATEVGSILYQGHSLAHPRCGHGRTYASYSTANDTNIKVLKSVRLLLVNPGADGAICALRHFSHDQPRSLAPNSVSRNSPLNATVNLPG
ncbi:hypothetical protein THASP1DRAFT_26598 [Thamnocephalis sphaerospora]|uniref:Uncharacterized protein n=1 Tax=Thamnocephalis sphaerospora TaxID=78915 RepID=A0A4P9XGP9_9FUNG|nr:hypothetical protein THASP1DRAFT_26598 [Thamnocephalis sphaerospora]|eukprot:RKP04825.1 hypothetical protein THASP1DRAFT_26598 [Thamnocephalis sphaerospora]